MKSKVQIKSTFGSLLFEFECETLEETVVEAVSNRANLRVADLRVADLRVADLRVADLRRNECSGGIHFFITREEAEDYC